LAKDLEPPPGEAWPAQPGVLVKEKHGTPAESTCPLEERLRLRGAAVAEQRIPSDNGKVERHRAP
jgi:hypothetical protein